MALPKPFFKLSEISNQIVLVVRHLVLGPYSHNQPPFQLRAGFQVFVEILPESYLDACFLAPFTPAYRSYRNKGGGKEDGEGEVREESGKGGGEAGERGGVLQLENKRKSYAILKKFTGGFIPYFKVKYYF